MAFTTFRGAFTWLSTDTAGTNYDVDCGFVPKFFVVWISGEDSATDAVGRDSATAGVGFWAADVRRSCVYGMADAQAAATIFARHSDVAILSLPDVTAPGGADSDGDLDVVAEGSWPTTTTIRFTVDTQIAGSFGNNRVQVLAFGGSDITNAKVGTIQEAADTGTEDYTDPGFQPTGMLLMSVGLGTAPPIDSGTQGMLSLGATDGTRSWVTYLGG